MRPSLSTILLMFLTAGCGTAYISPAVNDADGKVRVERLTAESVLRANASQYAPRQLPGVFFQNAGGARGQARSLGAAVQPVVDPQTRPVRLETRVPPAANPGAYRIGVGDVVLLATKASGGTVEELSGLLAAQNRRQGYTVQDDGAIAIPDVGRIMLRGRTLEEAESEVFQRLVANQLDPTFSLEIADFNSQRVSIGGAVAKPAVVPVTLTPLYLEQALSRAGGINTQDRKYATIRLYRDGTLYQLPLSEYRRRPDLQKLRLIDGDSVFVDTTYELDKARAYFEEQIRLAEFRQRGRVQALDELRAEVELRRAALEESRRNYTTRLDLGGVKRDYVYLSGEVTKPGRFALPFGQQATLADALFSEGGFRTETANPSQIYVLRAAPDPADLGAVTAWHLDARNAVKLTLATQLQMRPNDIIFVAEQPITKWNRVVRQIVPSLLTSTAAAARN